MKNILLLTTGAPSPASRAQAALNPKAMTKLMWVLGQGMTQQEISQSFSRSLAGEITI